MKKGDLTIKKKHGKQEYVSFDPRISADGKTFVLRVESGVKENWYNFMLAIYAYSKDEMDRIGTVQSERSQ